MGLVLVQITREYPEFAIAHQLHNMPEGHQCARLHGHNYKLSVTLRGWPHANNGMIMDAGDIDLVVKPVIAEVDHRFLNELGPDFLPMSAQPTAENAAIFFWNRLAHKFPQLYSVQLWENNRLSAEVIRT